MSLNRSQLRTKIREILRAFPDVDTVGTGGIDSSSTTLPVSNIDRYKAGDVLIIESEHVIVRSFNVTDGELTVTRAFQGTTAAPHSAAVAISILDEFTDRELNQTIDSAVKDSFPEIWIEVVDETLTTSTTAREYTIPSGFTFIKRIQVQNTNDDYMENRDWQLIGTKIQFSKDFTEASKTIRVIGQTYQALLTDDTTNLSISDEQADFIIYRAAVYALEYRFGNRIRATQYSASVNDRAGQPDQILRTVQFLRTESDLIKRREDKRQMHGFAHRPTR